MKGARVGVVGATGMVGRELVALLEKRRFPVSELRLFSSGRKKVSLIFRGENIPAPKLSFKDLCDCDLVFFVSSDEISGRYAQKLARRGIWVIDDSSAFRLDPKVPLIIPEVNARDIGRGRLIAGPNCTLAGLAVAAAKLHRDIGITHARVASYQSVSGAGAAAVDELIAQTRSLKNLKRKSDGRAPTFPDRRARALPREIALNVFPQIGGFNSDGSTSEEMKIAGEFKKVLSAPTMRVSATAVRVPTLRGHAMAAWFTLRKPVTPARARAILARTPGLVLSRGNDYPTPRSAGGTDPVYAARVRQGAAPNEIVLWIVTDNLLKGAALNSVQTAELLLRPTGLQ